MSTISTRLIRMAPLVGHRLHLELGIDGVALTQALVQGHGAHHRSEGGAGDTNAIAIATKLV
jgi:hypothetical protein